MKMEHGIYEGMPFSEYREIEAVNNTLLWDIVSKTPLHARYEQLHPKDTPSLVFGRALHAKVLEPDTFGNKYIVAPEVDRRTKAGKATWAAFVESAGGREVLTQEDAASIEAIAQAMQKQVIHKLVRSGEAEVVLVWEDEETGLLCKARLDYLHRAFDQIIIDLKSTEDASPEGFSRSMAKYGYHQQASFYSHGWEVLANLTPAFTFLAVEKNPPYAAAAYQIQAASLDAGEISWRKAIRTYAECLEKDQWPGYEDKILPIEIPQWALNAAGVNEFNMGGM